MALKTVAPYDSNEMFNMIDKDWMLITAKKDGQVNTMTASWGGFGSVWGRPVAFIFIRPQRFTKEFVEASENFSLSILKDGHRKELNYLGTISGRDEDKIANMGLEVLEKNDIPYFKESKKVFLCKRLYRQEMLEECFIDDKLPTKHYPTKDFHIMYIAEIEEVLAED